MSCTNCNCCTGLVNDNYSRGVYKGIVSVGTESAFLTVKGSSCSLKNKQLFRVYVPTNTGTTEPLYIVACNGVQAPLFLESTGVQATAASLIAGVTYLISYDDFSMKFFIIGL
jgi:hypothetical protein